MPRKIAFALVLLFASLAGAQNNGFILQVQETKTPAPSMRKYAELNFSGCAVSIFGITSSIACSDGLNTSAFSGSDFGEQLANCLAALPVVGGVCDATGVTGTQSITTDPFIGVTVPVVVRLGDVIINCYPTSGHSY